MNQKPVADGSVLRVVRYVGTIAVLTFIALILYLLGASAHAHAQVTAAKAVAIWAETSDGVVVKARFGNAQFHVDQDPKTHIWYAYADAVSLSIVPHNVVGQVLPMVNGSPQLTSVGASITSPVVYRASAAGSGAVRQVVGRDIALDSTPQPQGSPPIVTVRVLAGPQPTDSDVWIADYAAQ